MILSAEKESPMMPKTSAAVVFPSALKPSLSAALRISEAKPEAMIPQTSAGMVR